MVLSVSARNAARLCLSFFGAVLLAGCSASFQPSSVEPAQVPIGNIRGSVYGGQQPVGQGSIYLYAANTTGYNLNATSLITSGSNTFQDSSGKYYVMTDNFGNFSLSGDYKCTQGQLVYMVATAGNPGQGPLSTTATFANNSSTITVASATGISVGSAVLSGAGIVPASGTVTVTAVSGTTLTLSQPTTAAANPSTGEPVSFSVNNTAIVQMAGLGVCPASGSLAQQVPYLTINEVTTVAFAYSVSGFATNAYNVSTDATGVTALTNAFANASNIVNLQWGQAPTVTNGNPNSINPQAKIYTLANILATCVNSTPVSATQPSSQCSALFTAATPPGGAPPTDEATAILNIAHNQANNVTAVFNAGLPGGAFSPALGAPPADWTLPVIYTGLVSQPLTSETPPTYTSGPFNIAFDANGNAWIGDRKLGVVEVGPQGAATTYSGVGSTQFSEVKGVAVSPIDGTIWVNDYGANTVYVMSSTGGSTAVINNTSLAGNATLSGPILTSFSGNTATAGKAYLANETTTGVVVFNTSSYGFTDFATANLNNVATPGWISVDQNGIAWLPSTSTTYTGQVTYTQHGNSGKGNYSSSQATGAPNSYSTVADSSGNVWLAQITGTAQLEKIPKGSSAPQAKVWTNGGMNGPYKLALDGANNIWIANSNANTVSGFNTTAATPAFISSTGFSTSAPGGAGCVVAAPDPSGNLWAANSDGSVTQLLGLSTPTAAPFYGGLAATNGTTAGNLGSKP